MTDKDQTRTLVRSQGDGVEVRFRRSRLLVEAGPDKGQEFPLGSGPCVIGRGKQADLRLRDDSVSRAHARLEPCEEGWRLLDLESKTGTWVGEMRVEKVVLPPGGRVRLGETELLLRVDEASVQAEPTDELQGLVTQSPQMRRLFGMLQRLAKVELAILLVGESGTGKEQLARAVHELSSRSGGPYEVVDCTLLSGDHLRSELFGHVKGAFTGASSARDGAFVRADGGTLLLDEVGELPLDIQPMLLRVLEQGEVRALGSESSQNVRVRVLGATNRDLAAMVEAGEFRRDLYHRLAALEVPVPPLREREGDAIFLAEHFLGEGERLSGAARAAIESHSWRGNVRELRNAILRAAALSTDGELRAEDLGLRGATASAPEAPAGEDPASLTEWTEVAIRRAMEKHGGKRKEVAAELGISRTTLYRRLKELGLE
jgi:DNA-binding NtrC family response regulator